MKEGRAALSGAVLKAFNSQYSDRGAAFCRPLFFDVQFCQKRIFYRYSEVLQCKMI